MEALLELIDSNDIEAAAQASVSLGEAARVLSCSLLVRCAGKMPLVESMFNKEVSDDALTDTNSLIIKSIVELSSERFTEVIELLSGISTDEVLALSLREQLIFHETLLRSYMHHMNYDEIATQDQFICALIEKFSPQSAIYRQAQATHIAACLSLREFEQIESCSLVADWPSLPRAVQDQSAAIILRTWSSLHLISFEGLPQLRRWPLLKDIVFHGIDLIAADESPNAATLLGLSRFCFSLSPHKAEMDDQAGRGSNHVLQEYLRANQQIREKLYETREALRVRHALADSPEGLEGTGWLLVSVAERFAGTREQKCRVEHCKAYYRCLWRQGDKAEAALNRAGEPPSVELALERAYIETLRYYCSENWEVFLYRWEKTMQKWRDLGVTAASALNGHARYVVLHRDLCRLMTSFHLHHTLDHRAAVAAHERHLALFADNERYDAAHPFLHVAPQTTVIYFVTTLHFVKMKPELYAYNYYRKCWEEAGQGTLTLLEPVKYYALHVAQCWESSRGKEHTALSSIHLSVKHVLDSIAGIYKTHASRVVIVPTESLCCIPWGSMPSSDQRHFLDHMNVCVLPGLSYCGRGGAASQTGGSGSRVVAVRSRDVAWRPSLKMAINEARIASHHLHCEPTDIFVEDPSVIDGSSKASLHNVGAMLTHENCGALKTLHFSAHVNGRRMLLLDGQQLTLRGARALASFPRAELVVLSGMRTFGGETLEGPLAWPKLFLARGAAVVMHSTVPLYSPKVLQLLANFYSLYEACPGASADQLLRHAIRDLRLTTSELISWGSFQVVGVERAEGVQQDLMELPPGWKFPRLV